LSHWRANLRRYYTFGRTLFSGGLGAACLGGVEGPELGPFGNTST
jgi:hypothetical protein